MASRFGMTDDDLVALNPFTSASFSGTTGALGLLSYLREAC